MATVTFRSELYYAGNADTAVSMPKPNMGKVLAGVKDAIFEYPGSRKGDFGEWRLTDWLDAKIQEVLATRGGRERR